MSDWKSRSKVLEASDGSSGGWRERSKPMADVGSPLDQAMASQTGDVVTVETPTGPAKFTRGGERFYDPEEAEQIGAGGGARFKERALEEALTFFGNGGPTGALKGMQAVALPGGSARAGESLLDTYRRIRAAGNKDVDLATAKSPEFEVKGVKLKPVALAGAALPSILAPNPVSAFGRIGLGVAIGAEQAAFQSDADLTHGELGKFFSDVGDGAEFGLLAGGAAEGLAAPGRALIGNLAGRIGNNVSRQAAADVERVAKEVAHLKGVARAETQKGSRYTENILRHGNGLTIDPSGVTDPNQLASIAATQQPWFKELADEVAANTRTAAPGQKAVIDAAKAEASGAAASAAQDASDRTRDYFKQSTFGSQIQPRLVTLAENALLGGAAGAATGGASGLFRGGLDQLADGVIAGIGGSALSGGSGLKTLAKNAMASPLVRTSALESAIRATQGAQSAARGGAKAMTATRPQIKDDEAAIDAFLTGG